MQPQPPASTKVHVLGSEFRARLPRTLPYLCKVIKIFSFLMKAPTDHYPLIHRPL